MKKLLLGLTLASSILSINPVKASCTREYFEKTQGGNNVSRYVENNWNELQWLAYINGAILISNPVIGAVVYTLPLTVWLGAEIADTVHDERLQEMIRIINFADYKVGIRTPPNLRDDYVTIIDVDGDTARERRIQRSDRRDAKSHNRRINRYNEDISRDLERSKTDFESLLAKLQKAGSNMTADELAQKISDLNATKSLCNGEVGTIGIDQDDLITKPRIAVDGKTKKERREQRRENNRIEAHNDRAFKKLNSNILATQEDIVKFLK
jgi:hypothetical protein